MDYSSFQTLKSLSFDVFSNDEIRSLSALEITNTEILDSLGHPTTGGLHDLHLGPNETDDFCLTCGLNFFKCLGHPGHITLPVPVYNPVLLPKLFLILRGSCLNCHRLSAPESQLCLVLYQLRALDYGLVSTVEELAEIMTDASEVIVKGFDYTSTIKSKLKRKFEEATQGLDINDMKQPVRSVVECRKKVVQNFIRKYMMGVTSKCHHCKVPNKKLKLVSMRIVYVEKNSRQSTSENEPETISSELLNKEIFPEDARKHMHLLWENDKISLQNLFKILHKDNKASVDMFFMDFVLVPPSKFRRLDVLKGRKYADSQTILLNEILKDCHAVRSVLKVVKNMPLDDSEKDLVNKVPGKTNGDKFNYLYHQLQGHINELFDSDTNKSRAKLSKGIKQILEKKQGLFRMNIMGKRVNFAARSVISPDPYINVNEIGVPLVFAKKLTFPEPVSHWNFEKMRQAVKNGPEVHPGAVLVEYEDGRVVRLPPDQPVRRKAIANTLLTPQASLGKNLGKVKIVHRHLRDGDMLLVNRQPTLHKPSIMAHKARVLPGEKTLRLHYANCKAYNADFDGDEMNAHLPQSYLGQSECRHIVNVNHQYLVPKDGTPLSGLIQDHIIAGLLLTMRGRFFSKDDYHQLLYSALSFLPKRLKLLPPAIIKPHKLWSGKQIVSSLIINLTPEGKIPPTLEGKAKITSKNWINAPSRPWEAGGTPFNEDNNMCESEVIIRGGELLCGVIDKAQVGPTPYSLIHLCYELYGGEVSSTMLTSLARLFTHYLQYCSGFSLGIEDIIVSKKADRQRKKILKKANAKGLIASAEALDVENPEDPDMEELLRKYKDAHHNRDDFQMKVLDNEIKNVTQELNNDIRDACMPVGLIKPFPMNNLQLMIESGAKGTLVNAMQISDNLGQIDLEGQRPRPMLNGSTLPSFKPYDTSPAAGGFVAGRFLTGINPQEYFFHCMAGREGLIDTAVKTSRSGYLQRCLIKHLEGITVNYDLTVRDSDGTVIQFLYGEDGLDVLKTQMLKEKSLHLLAQNYDAAVNEQHLAILQNKVEVDLEKLKKRIRRWKKKHPNPLCRTPLVKSLPYAGSSNLTAKERIQRLSTTKMEIDDLALKEFNKNVRKCPDPVNAFHRPDHVFGSVSEKLDEMILDYVNKNLQNQYANSLEARVSPENFMNMCYYRALRSLAEPGETVGLLAAQSIGEPSTQMTLNTFHFAGKGEMNVTLGIPRIREILMNASPNIATPTMDLPLLDKPDILEKAEKLTLQLNPVSLKQVLDSIKVKEYFSVHSHLRDSFHNYVIKLNFLKYSEYKGLLFTTPTKILHYVEKVFIRKLIDAIKKKKRQTSASNLINTSKETSSFGRFTEGCRKIEEDTEANQVPDEPPRQDDEEESSGAESDGDGDTISTKSKMRHNQEQEYEDPEEEEELPEESEDETEKEEEVTIKQEVLSDEENKTEEISSTEHIPIPENVAVKRKSISDNEKQLRINAAKCTHFFVSNYDFDTKNSRWCEISLRLKLDANSIDMKTLLEEEVDKALVHSVPYIKQALLVKNPDSENGCNMMIKTNGVNFLEIFKHVDILDVNKAYSNNIHAIREIYGIEAAARAIKKEIENVFKPYGISVDNRHLSLISDYMTSSGFYRSCNRLGMEGCSSPLQQMTFETTKNFLVDAMLMGTEEKLKGPSSSIAVGQLFGGGTGSFDIFTKINC